MKSVKHYFCPIPFKIMKMKNLSAFVLILTILVVTGCGKIGKKASKGTSCYRINPTKPNFMRNNFMA